MNSNNKPTRRTVLAGQAALLAAAAAPGAAQALTPVAETAATNAAPTASILPRWETATAEELKQFIGQRFQVQTAEHGNVVLRLKSVEPVHSGAARPAELARADGVSAIFESPDQEALVALGHQTHKVRHARLGSTDLFMGPVPTRNGDPVIEVLLN